MEKKVYKKGDAQRARTAAAPARPAKAPAARQAASRPPAPAAPARRTVSTAKATVRTAKAAVHTAPKRRRKSRVLPFLLCFLLIILIIGNGAVLLHRTLAARTADTPAEAPAFSQPPVPTEAPAAPSEPPSVSEPEPEPEPEAEPTLADTIRTAEASDLSQWPELAAALQGSTNAGFMAIDLAGGKTLACQPDTALYIASAIKAPYALYVCRQLDAGNVFEDEAIEYLEKFYDEGSGNIKSAQPGTMYRLDYLLQESILHSDNIAYRLLVNRCGKEDFNAMLDSLGITGMHFTATNIWPKATPRELALCWNEIYNYIQSGAPHSALLAQILTNSSAYSPIRKAFVYQRTVAAKYGWDQSSYVDAGIVYSAEGQPQYLLAILTENGELESGGALAITTKLIRQIDAAMASMQ